MAYKTLSSLLPILLVSSIILAMPGETVAARSIPGGHPIDDKKQPEWFIGYDGISVLIPGVGRVTLPPYDKSITHGGYKNSYGSTGGNGQYIPGADDTLVPNPGYEVPNPKYEAPNPEYEAPNPEYEAPNPEYEAPNPEYEAPAPNPEYDVPNP